MKKEIHIALVGNPNSGKTTLFNALTGGNQYVGNWPGVTVEKKEGKIKGKDQLVLQDLPGIYSLSPYSLEEVTARDYLLSSDPNLILNIVDGSNLERNLFLTSQLAELNIPMLVAINMIDVVEKRGDRIDIAALEKALHCPVVAISAGNKTGLDVLMAKLEERLEQGKGQDRFTIFSSSLEDALKDLSDLSKEDHIFPLVKILEKDPNMMEKTSLSKEEKERVNLHIQGLEKEYDDDMESIFTSQRYLAIHEALKSCYQKEKGKVSLSNRIDQIVTHKFFALPIFAAIMSFVYFIAIAGVGEKGNGWIEEVLFGQIISNGVGNWLESIGASGAMISLVVDGIIGGVSAPVSFLPQMILVFIFLAFLEDCGYMSRVAFIMDRLFRSFGLSGKSFISFLVSAGCAVPGILACRTIESERDRKLTMITTGAMPCSAKLPVIALITSFLLGNTWWVAPLVYLLSIVVVIVLSIIMKKMGVFSGEVQPFVMELPDYHWPSIEGIYKKVSFRLIAFLKKAGSLIFVASVLMWFFMSFGFTSQGLAMVEAENSILALVGNWIAPIFKPLGFGSWQAVAATFSGFAAKELVVSTMGILSGLGEIESYAPAMRDVISVYFPVGISGISFLVFNLYNSPCLAALTTLSKEIGSRKSFLLALLIQNLSAYAFSLMIYQIGGYLLGQVAFSIATIFAFFILGLLLFLLFRPESRKKKHYSIGLAKS